MMKHSLQLLLAVATSALAGCSLYFGDESNNGSWNYCGDDGYYECEGNDCYWRSPTCPSGTGSGGGGGGGMTGGGFECNDNSDCAAGCYCGDGVCEEAGFCTNDSQCGNGYTCNEARSSCEPTGGGSNTSCGADNDCAEGQYCDSMTLKCTASCTCTSDAHAKDQGYDYCDSSRNTCLLGVDPNGDCDGMVTCSTARPACPQGSVALISEGCYTGLCQPVAECALPPTCSAYGHESDCRADTDCQATYTGFNCRDENDPTVSCTAGMANCKCDSFAFASCLEKTP